MTSMSFFGLDVDPLLAIVQPANVAPLLVVAATAAFAGIIPLLIMAMLSRKRGKRRIRKGPKAYSNR